jgi:hypothetical protein
LANFCVVGLGILDSFSQGVCLGVHNDGSCCSYSEKFIIQKHAIIIFIKKYPLFKVWTLRQSVSLVVSAGLMDDSERKLG